MDDENGNSPFNIVIVNPVGGLKPKSDYEHVFSANDRLVTMWKESQFQKFKGLFIEKNKRSVQFVFNLMSAETRPTGFKNYDIGIDGSPFAYDNVESGTEIIVPNEDILDRLHYITIASGEPDETIKALRAEEYYKTYGVVPEV